MPRVTELDVPFAPRLSPDFHRASQAHLQWPRKFGFLTSDEERRGHERARYSELAARFYPTAVGADLDLGVDLMSWFFLFDDIFDGPAGRAPRAAADLVDALQHVLVSAPGRGAPPVVAAFCDVWTRSRVGMSAAWQERAARHWRGYLTAHVTEAEWRLRDHRATVGDHLRLRDETVGAKPTLDLAERVTHAEVPAHLHTIPRVCEMRRAAASFCVLHNDLSSVEKEHAAGDVHNLVLVLERERGWTRERAVAETVTMLEKQVDRFVLLERCLPDLYNELGLDAGDRTVVNRYVEDVLHALVRGSFDWTNTSDRYG